jgi:hypothetical protein
VGGHQTGQGKILKTTDGGQTWVSQAHGSNNNFYAVAFADANNGVTVTLAGEIFETADSGATWVRRDVVTKNLYGASMVDMSAATVVGSRGAILRRGTPQPTPTPTPTATPSPTPTPTPTPTATPTSTPTPGQITLSAHGYKVHGIQTVDLTWSGAISANIDVYRNGVVVATVPNTGAYTDSIGVRGGNLRYIYKVCEAATSNCSNEVTVRFGGPPR